MNPINKTSLSYILNPEELENDRPSKMARIDEPLDTMDISSEKKSTSIDDLTDDLLFRILSIVSRSTSSVERRRSGLESALCTSKKWSIEAAKIKKRWFENNDISFVSYNCTTAKDVLKCAVEKELKVLHLWDKIDHNIIETAKMITDDELNGALRKLPNLRKLTVSSNALTTLDLSKTTKLEELSIIHPKKLSNIILNTNLNNLNYLLLNSIQDYLSLNLLQNAPNLHTLHFVSNESRDNTMIEAIANHTKLDQLRLNAFYAPTFNPLEKLTNLEALYFAGSNANANQLKIILKSMPKIFHLQITSTETSTDEEIFDLVSEFPQIESLYLNSGSYKKDEQESWYREEPSESSEVES